MTIRGYSAVGLHNPKSKENVGSALRACGVYSASMMAISGKRYRASCTDTMQAHRHMPFHQVDDLHGIIPFNCVPVAVELLDNAESLVEFKHPEKAFCVFGPEDGTLGKAVTNWCMNLAATVNVVLYDRLFKQIQSAPQEN